MTLEAYALKILADHGCDEYSYGGTCGDTILSDLKEAYPNGMEYPYVDVANAIMAISKMRPIVRHPWMMLWDNGSACDGIGYDSLEAAQGSAEDTLIEWMAQTRMEWKDMFSPTEEELEDYNYMIASCSVHIDKYDPMTDEYDEYWYPSYEDEERICWKELTMEDIAREKSDFDAAAKKEEE